MSKNQSEEKFTYPNFPPDLEFKEPHFTRYIKFIESRELRTISEESYTEKHHMIPKSLGGSNKKENLIQLTAREHFIVHLILWKGVGGKMSWAFLRMKEISTTHYNSRYFKLNSKQYEKLRKDFKHTEEAKKKISTANKGKTSPMKGKSFTEEHKHKIGVANKGKQRTEKQKQAMSKNLKGIKRTEEFCIRMSEERKGENNHFYGKKHNEEAKKKMSNAKKGKKSPIKGIPKSKEHKEKISKTLKGNPSPMKDRKHNNKSKKSMSQSKKGSKRMNKNGINKFVKKENIEKYVNDGWAFGWI